VSRLSLLLLFQVFMWSPRLTLLTHTQFLPTGDSLLFLCMRFFSANITNACKPYRESLVFLMAPSHVKTLSLPKRLFLF
jgi:hypothetical protein